MNINLLTEVEVESLNRLIDEANHIAIYTHRSPDGDAIGSTLGMANYLKQRGKEDVKVIVPDMFPNFLQWLPRLSIVNVYTSIKTTLSGSHETLKVGILPLHHAHVYIVYPIFMGEDEYQTYSHQDYISHRVAEKHLEYREDE